MMINIVNSLIYLHAGLGGLALLSGLLAILSKKGQFVHKKSGKLFFFSMFSSVLISILITFLPEHENPFLFSIGIFSLFLISTGYRALSFKNKNHNFFLDKLISYSMILMGLFMVVSGTTTKQINIVSLIFGIVGMYFAITDVLSYRNIDLVRKKWLEVHLSRMMGGFISCVTAFFVVNQLVPGVYGWFLPTVIGTPYIIYHISKLKK